VTANSPTDSRARPRYRFPPLERRGVIAGWRAGQIGSVAAGLVLAVLTIRSRPSLSGVVVAIVFVGTGLALAFWPIAGRTGEQWLPVVVRWAWAGVTGHRFQSASGPASGSQMVIGEGGHGIHLGQMEHRPRMLASSVMDGLRIEAANGPDGREGMGVVVDDRARTLTAVLAVRGHSFALLGPAEQDARVAAWARVLSSLARDGSSVHRLQWVETCLPDDGRAVRSYFDDHAVLDGDDRAARSYRTLLDESTPVTRRHRVLVAITLHRGRAARAVRAGGGGMSGAAAVLEREVAAVHRALAAADLEVEGILGRAGLVEVLAAAFDAAPSHESPDSPAALGGADVGRTGSRYQGALSDPWPVGVEARWDAVRTDGTWHAVYWVSEWPRVDTSPDFLGPVLFAPLRRTLSMVMEPIDPARAARQVAQARTAGMADGELRRRNGFLSSARHQRERQSVDDRDEELADGHAQFRFSGYLGVTADSEAELVAACAALEQSAGQARLEVKRLYGQQDSALLCLLPLGRGLS